MKTSSYNSLPEEIVHTLGRAIVRGDLTSKSTLSESGITARFGVSRTVAREAVKSLVSKKLIVSRPKVGIKILSQMEWDFLDQDVIQWCLESPNRMHFLEDAMNVRRAMQPLMVGLTAKLASERLRWDIERAYVDFVHASHREAIAECLHRFHNAVVSGENSPLLRSIHSSLGTPLQYLTRAIAAGAPFDFGPYAEVMDSIRKRDEMRAEGTMRKLVDYEYRLLTDTTAFQSTDIGLPPVKTVTFQY